MRNTLLMLAALLTLGAVAHAQGGPPESDRVISIGLGGGVTVPVSDLKESFKNGFNGQGFIRLRMPGLPIQPRLEFTYNRFSLKDVNFKSSGTGQILSGLAGIQVHLLPGPVRPYVLASLGPFKVTSNPDSLGSTSQTKFGINGGAGVEIKLKGLSLYVEGRVNNVYTDSGLVDASSIKLVPVTFGIVY